MAAPDVVATLQQTIHAALEPAMRTIAEFAELGPDWDSYGAKPPTPEARRIVADSLQLFVSALAPFVGERALPYWVSPLRNGGVQIEWRSPATDLEVEVGPEGGLSFLFREGQGEGRSVEESDDANLEDVVLRLHRVVAP